MGTVDGKSGAARPSPKSAIAGMSTSQESRPPPDHDRGGAVADDVADAHQLRGDVAGHLRGLERGDVELGDAPPELDDRGGELEEPAREQPLEDEAGLRPPLLSRDQHLRAGRALGVGQLPVLLDDQVPAQRDHHEHAEHAAGEGQHHRARPVQGEAEEDERGQGEGDPRRDALPRRARRLDHAVLEDAGARAQDPREGAEERDGDDGDGDGGGDREADPEGQVDGGGAEDDAQERAHDERAHASARAASPRRARRA